MGAFHWEGRYKDLNSTSRTDKPHPVIGITGNYDKETCMLAEGYYQSVLQAGGIPFIIPPFLPDGRLGELLDGLDGILFSGGGDINPLLLGEEPIKELHSITPERDMQELLLARMAYDRQIPMLGICKGIQVINAALGGTNYQDIHTQMEGMRIKHSQDQDRRYPSHTVTLTKGSMLERLFAFDMCGGTEYNSDHQGIEKLPVNSFHHQACKDVASCLSVSAMSEDGVIEAIESCEFKSVLAVQWHPETYILRNDRSMMPIFKWLVEESTEFKRAKALHDKILTLDSHCDTPMFFSQGINFASRDPKVLVDLHKMADGHLDATIMAAYLEQQERDEASLENATAKANQILTQIEEMAAQNCTAVDIAYTPADLWRLKREGKRAIMLGIENGYAIGKDIRNVQAFRQRGVVYMTLCHNGDNDICDSARGNREHGGVSEFGAEVIAEMNRVGMMVDLSHASEESFYDAIKLSRTPIVCSHSSARTLCDHPRNLTDAQLRALADAGGVAQVTLYHGFLVKDSVDYNPHNVLRSFASPTEGVTEATILDAIEHLNHMVNVMGIEHVGIGTDFDGDGGIRGCASASELINFTRRLLRERYTDEQIQMIWGGNFLRVMQEVQRQA
ncbi:MAG: gamma-glutamyl-gamma-aminobutyrate hydrolase family protein [Bacteroidaceae bacterium]|nr:gamma-glutamyl-gamma-aminobutyrate hydrolase family protein [Bacteroidaceae bacterium]